MPFRSPFEPAFAARGAVLGALGDVSVALRFGDTPRELLAFRQEAALVDLAWRGILRMTGRDRVRFLHGMCTNDIKKLRPGEGCVAAIVTRQGKMVAEMVAYATEQELLLEMDRAALPLALEHLNRFLVADDVKLETSAAGLLGLWGPRAASLLGMPDLGDFHFLTKDDVLAAKDRTLGLDGYHLIVPPDRSTEVERLLAAGATAAGFEAFETLRISAGFPRWGADMDGSLLPMEAGLEPLAISYSKGCYIGQEVIQRVKTYSEPSRMLVQLEVAEAQPGQKISGGGEEIGMVTSALPSLALGIVRREFRNPGAQVEVEGRPARVAALPWQRILK